MTHPKDIEYIRTMLPNISADVIEKQKILQPGNCVGFGGAFKLPMVIKMEMPNPAPNSNSCDVNNCWKVQGNAANANSNNGQGNNGGGQAQVTPSMPTPQMGAPTNAASHVTMALPSKPQLMPATEGNNNQGNTGGVVSQGMAQMPPQQGNSVPVQPNFIPPVS